MKEESQPLLTHERNILVFWEEDRPSGMASVKSGRALFENVLMMRVSVPGDNKNTMEYWVQITYPLGFPHSMYGEKRVNQDIRPQFGKYIDKYLEEQGGPQIVSGTAIEHWPPVNRAQVNMLKHNGIYSVEALAGLTDGQIAGLGMEGRKLVQQAVDWLQSASRSAAAMESAERERRLEERFGALEGKYTELAEALAELPPEAQALVRTKLGKKGQKAAA